VAGINRIVLITVDTLRHDCIKSISDTKYLKRDKVLKYLDTPNLDKIAKDSVCFTKCYTTSSVTSSVHASMFTGTMPVDHNIRCTTTSTTSVILNENIMTIAEILKRIGFKTVMLSESNSILRIPKVARGFDHFFKTEKEMYNFLEKNKDQKIFLFALFEDVHAPYLYSFVPPEKNYNDDYFQKMEDLYNKHGQKIPKDPTEIWSYFYKKVNNSRKIWFPLYVQGVSKFDKGRFKFFIENIEKFGFMDKERSVFILTADHGEGKNKPKKDTFEHNGEAYDEIAKVPLLVRIPTRKHYVNNDLVSNIDIFRIILDNCTPYKTNDIINYNLSCINPFREKRSFAWYIYGIDLGTDGKNYLLQSRTIITDDKKYILRGRPEIYETIDKIEENNTQFVTNLFHNLYCRTTKEETIQNFSNKMTENAFTKKILGKVVSIATPKDSSQNYIKNMNKNQISRNAIYRSFILSDEYAMKNPFSVIDLEYDHFEDNEFSPTRDLFTLIKYSNFIPFIFKLEIPQVIPEINSKTDNIQSSDEDEEEVQKALKELGYI